MKINNNNKLKEVPIETLAKAIHDLHGCKAKWVESIPIKETFEGQTVWEGIVQVFDLINHPTAKKCYAWSHSIDDSSKRRFYAVLHQHPIDSPQAAVRAAIASEFNKVVDYHKEK